MKQRFKHKLALATATIAFATSVAGCSGSSSEGGSEKTLTMWTFKQNQVAALEAVGDAWSKESGVKVEVTAYTPDDSYTTKVRAAARTKGLPDIVSAHAGNEDWQFAAAGILQDITADFDKEWSDLFIPSVLAADTLTETVIKNSGTDPATTLKDLKADHTYAVPYLAGTPGVVYTTKSALKVAGLDGPPATWEEWVTAMKRTVAADPENGGLVTGLQVPQTGFFWVYRPMSYAVLGPDKFTSRQTKGASAEWSSAENVKTFEYYDQLTPVWSRGVLALGIDQADQAFAQGKAAWNVGGTFTFGTLAQNGVKAEEVVTFPIPSPEGSAVEALTYAPSPLISAGVSPSSKKKTESVEFLKFLSSKKGAAIFADEAADVPATRLLASDVSNPLVKQMLGLFSTDAGGQAFNPNDLSADPGGGVGNIGDDISTVINELPAKSSSPAKLAAKIAAMYRTAWDKQN